MEVETAIEEYHKWYYDSRIWKSQKYKGWHIHKALPDLWNYQEIIYSENINLVIETGVCYGGSAVYFADHVDEYIGIDIVALNIGKPLPANITLIQSDSANKELWRSLAEIRKSKAMIILDSDHSKSHVYNEMVALEAFIQTNDILVVEDTNINGHPVLENFGAGPMEGMAQYLEENQGKYKRLNWDERFGWSFAPKGYLRRLG
jgi:cephalosporin hydroxylase